MTSAPKTLRKNHWSTMFRLLRFMKPLNGVMLVSIIGRIGKMWGSTILIAVAAGSVAKYVADPTTDQLWSIGGWLVLGAFGLGLFH